MIKWKLGIVLILTLLFSLGAVMGPLATAQTESTVRFYIVPMADIAIGDDKTDISRRPITDGLLLQTRGSSNVAAMNISRTRALIKVQTTDHSGWVAHAEAVALPDKEIDNLTTLDDRLALDVLYLDEGIDKFVSGSDTYKDVLGTIARHYEPGFISDEWFHEREVSPTQASRLISNVTALYSSVFLAVVFEDFFTEGSSTALESHTPDTGTAWTLERDGHDVEGSLGYATNSAAGAVTTSDDIGSEDYIVQADIYIQANSARSGIGVRFTDINNSIHVRIRPSNNEFRMNKLIGGSDTTVSASTSDTINEDTFYTLKFEVSGSGASQNFDGYFEGTLRLNPAAPNDAVLDTGEAFVGINDTNSAGGDGNRTDNYSVNDTSGAASSRRIIFISKLFDWVWGKSPVNGS